MSVPLLIFIIALIFIVFFYKDVHAFVYFVVIIDIFLRIITYLKLNILRADAFGFLNYIPENIPSIWSPFITGTFSEILMATYIIVYIIFEVFVIIKFVKRKF